MSRILPTALLLVVTLTSTAPAHFLWLVPNAETGRVEVYFAESADPDDPELLDRLKGIVIHQRAAADAKQVAHDALRKEDWLAIQPKSLDGTFALSHDYGVISRGQDTFLLRYASKAYTGTPASWVEYEKPVAELDVVARREGDRLVFEARLRGEPTEGVEFTVDTPDFDRLEGKTNAKGVFGVPVKNEGRYAARAKFVEEKAGKIGDDEYGSIRHYTTVTLGSSAGTKEQTSAGLPDLPIGLTSFGAAILDGKVYVYGGHMGTAHSYYREGQSDKLLRLDLANPKEWMVVGTVPRRQGLALVPHGGYLYRVGGFEARNAEGEDRDLASTADFARFDPRTGKWEDLADMPVPRSSHDAVVIGDRLYVVGGWAMGAEESEWHDSALVADLSAEEIAWVRLPNPPFHRRALATGDLGGKLAVVGGMQEEGGPTAKVALYDPTTKKWTEGPELVAEGRMAGFGASAMRLGEHLYVATYDGTVQRMAAGDQGWTTLGKLESPRFFHRLLPDENRLLVVGGASMTSGKVLEVETIDPYAVKEPSE